MPAWGYKHKHLPLTRPTTITQLLKAARKGHVTLSAADRLAIKRHRRGARGHETPGLPQ